MHGRDQEVISLKQRNEELERALAEANSAMCAIGNGGTLSGPTGYQGRLQDPVRQPEQDPLGGAGVARVSQGPQGLSDASFHAVQGKFPGATRGDHRGTTGLGAPLNS